MDPAWAQAFLSRPYLPGAHSFPITNPKPCTKTTLILSEKWINISNIPVLLSVRKKTPNRFVDAQLKYFLLLTTDAINTPVDPALRFLFSRVRFCTYPWSLPLEVDRDALAVEERRVLGGEIGILKQLLPLEALLPQLLVALAVSLRRLGLDLVARGAEQSGSRRHPHTCYRKLEQREDETRA